MSGARHNQLEIGGVVLAHKQDKQEIRWVFDYRIPLQPDDALDSLDVHSIQLSSATISIIILFHSKN